MTTKSARTAGSWDFACDSYGKVRHSKKACVFTTVKTPTGDRLVKVAAQIENWSDARLLAAAPALLAALKLAEQHVANVCGETSEADLPDWFADLATVRAAIAKAEGR